MAIITEEPELTDPLTEKPPKKPLPQRKTTLSPPPPPSSSSATTSTNPFQFWFYFTLVVSLITLLFVYLPSFYSEDPKAWFLNLPLTLRHHYSKGRIFKVQIAPNLPQVDVFTIQEGPFKYDHQVLIVHGFGCSSFAFLGVVKYLGLQGVHAVAVDLPGSGFSDKSMIVVEEIVSNGGAFGKLWKLYSEIKVKGLFWGFDQLIEKGYVNYEENAGQVLKREVVRTVELGPEEMGRVLGQVIDAMGLAPVDLVLHDSALGLSANWISENPRLVRSVVILDGVPSRMALPLWALSVPVVREAILGNGFTFDRLLGRCCFSSASKSEAEAHRVLLKGRDGRRAVVGMGKKLNYTFDLAKWGGSVGMKGLPLQVIWSSVSSDSWKKEGRHVAEAIPQAAFVSHSGSRWPQEQNAEEIANSIYQFVASLPKIIRQDEEDSIPEHLKTMVDEEKNSDHHHHHGHGAHDHHHGHDHSHTGYADAYGVGNAWAI